MTEHERLGKSPDGKGKAGFQPSEIATRYSEEYQLRRSAGMRPREIIAEFRLNEVTQQIVDKALAGKKDRESYDIIPLEVMVDTLSFVTDLANVLVKDELLTPPGKREANEHFVMGEVSSPLSPFLARLDFHRSLFGRPIDPENSSTREENSNFEEVNFEIDLVPIAARILDEAKTMMSVPEGETEETPLKRRILNMLIEEGVLDNTPTVRDGAALVSLKNFYTHSRAPRLEDVPIERDFGRDSTGEIEFVTYPLLRDLIAHIHSFHMVGLLNFSVRAEMAAEIFRIALVAEKLLWDTEEDDDGKPSEERLAELTQQDVHLLTKGLALTGQFATLLFHAWMATEKSLPEPMHRRYLLLTSDEQYIRALDEQHSGRPEVKVSIAWALVKEGGGLDRAKTWVDERIRDTSKLSGIPSADASALGDRMLAKYRYFKSALRLYEAEGRGRRKQ